MTDREKVRQKIDDNLTSERETFTTGATTYMLQLKYNPVQDVIVKIDGTDATVDSDYFLEHRTGRIMAGTYEVPATFPANKPVEVFYRRAAFLDEDIDSLLEDNPNPVGAAVAAVQILLMSAARRFDYQRGHTRMNTSQVFDHLKQLLETLKLEYKGLTGNASIVQRSSPYDSDESVSDSDLSRTDIFP